MASVSSDVSSNLAQHQRAGPRPRGADGERPQRQLPGHPQVVGVIVPNRRQPAAPADGLTLTGAASYIDAELDEDYRNTPGGPILAPKGQSLPVTPKFKFNDRLAMYARVAKGFRPGGPNVIALNSPPGIPTSYESDTTLNYELGLKG